MMEVKSEIVKSENIFFGIFRRMFGALFIFISIVTLTCLGLAESATKCNAQKIIATLKADSTHIVIGDKLNVKLTVKFSGNGVVALSHPTDTLGRMELLSASNIDSTIERNAKQFTQSFVVSAYDSGSFRTGPLKIFFTNTNGERDTLYSDFFYVSVSTVAVDTTKPIKLIKSPLSVPYSLSEFLPIIIGAAIALVVIAIIIYFIWRRSKRKKTVVIEKPRPKDPAHIWAKKELKKLEEEKIWQRDEVKLYYSRLTDILRQYLEYRFNWNALESTTEEIEENISGYDVTVSSKEILLSILKSADFVKFAKKLPLPNENMKAMENAIAFIDSTKPSEASAQ